MTINKESKYNIIGSISCKSPISVYVGNIKEDSTEEMLLINEFSKENKNLLIPISSVGNKEINTVLKSFSVSDQNFYIVFKFYSGENIKNKFCEAKNVYSLPQRIDMIENLLIHVVNTSYLPLNIRLCSLEPSNLVVNLKNDIKINYNLCNISSYDNNNKKNIFKSIARVLEIVFEHEIKILNNQYIKLVIDKCDYNLFKSIPELIVELKKACFKKNKNILIQQLKHIISIYKDKIKRLAYIGGIVASVLLCIFLLPSILNPKVDNQYFKIGKVEYNPSLNNSTGNSIMIEKKITESKQEELIDLSIPSNLDIEFDDYIVKPNDSIKIICNKCYSNTSFISTIKSYNGIESDENLIPGMIIKIPNETLVKDYFSI